MNDNSYTTTFTVDESPDEVFNAINNVREWWSEDIEGSTDKLGAEWTYNYHGVQYKKQQITELVPGKKVVWHVVNSSVNFAEEEAEWTGTDIVFEITQKGHKTEVHFTHVGLVPAMVCYEDCSGAWDAVINDSLRSLITTGKGKPSEKEE